MGYAKQKLLEAQERGWSSIGDKFVCAKCFDDYALSQLVTENAAEFKCDYCGHRSRKKPIAAPMDEVMEAIDEGIRSEWGHPDDEGIIYESAEGGYQGTVIDT
jgi:DNA-directed RNA polymerase subunit RPC12/RpoP